MDETSSAEVYSEQKSQCHSTCTEKAHVYACLS